MSANAIGLDNAFSPIMHMLFGIESRLLAAETTSFDVLLAELADGLSSLSLRIPPHLLEFPLVACWSEIEGPGSTLRVSTHGNSRVKVGVQPQRKGSRTPKQLSEYFKQQIRKLYQARGFCTGQHPVELDDFLSDLSIRRYQGLSSYWHYKSRPLGDAGPEIHVLAFPKLYPIGASGCRKEIHHCIEQLENFLIGGLPRLLRLSRSDEEMGIGRHHEEDKSLDAGDTDDPLSFTGILTDIHVSSIRLECASSDERDTSSSEIFDDLRRYFRMLVCRPIILSSTHEQGFQYALSSIQHQKLKNVARTPSWEISLETELQSILEKERIEVLKGYNALAESDTTPEPAKKVGCWPDTEPIARLIRNISAIPEKNRSRQQDQFLRTAAMWLYAMSGTDDLRRCIADPDHSWPARIAEVSIGRSQAELIDQVLVFADSEVIEEPFIAHELSQALTSDILEATRHLWSTQAAAPNSILYPAFLHLSERLLFPARFFLYPLFYRGFPVSVFGFDADRFNEDRGKIIEILRDHSGSLFLAALHSEFHKVFKKFIGVLEDFAQPDTDHSPTHGFEDELQSALEDKAFHFAGERASYYDSLYAQMNDAIRAFKGGSENRARYESNVLLLGWLHHELSHVGKAVSDVMNSATLDRSKILQRTRMYTHTVKLVSEIAAPGHENTPLSTFEEYAALLQSLLPPEIKFVAPRAEYSEFPSQMLLVMVELVRNASKTAIEVKVELRNSDECAELTVLSDGHTEEDWQELNEAIKRAKNVDLKDLLGLLGREEKIGVPLVQLLANSVRGSVEYSKGLWEGHLLIRSVCQMPLASPEKEA